jgi:hypothetical protein
MDQRDLDYVQNDPQYKDKTALVLPTDHGHGDTKKNGQVMEISLKGLQEYILRLWDQKIEGKEKKNRISIVSK